MPPKHRMTREKRAHTSWSSSLLNPLQRTHNPLDVGSSPTRPTRLLCRPLDPPSSDRFRTRPRFPAHRDLLGLVLVPLLDPRVPAPAAMPPRPPQDRLRPARARASRPLGGRRTAPESPARPRRAGSGDRTITKARARRVVGEIVTTASRQPRLDAAWTASKLGRRRRRAAGVPRGTCSHRAGIAERVQRPVPWTPAFRAPPSGRGLPGGSPPSGKVPGPLPAVR